MITIEHLQKYYNKGKDSEQHVLNDISLTFGDTGLVCILGESGSGKTTLLNTVGGLDTFSGGRITINGTRLTKYDPARMEPVRNEHFGYIFQNYYLLKDYTVAYNVRLALNRYDLTEEEKDERVEYVLSMLGMSKYKKKAVSKLSGGQQQRVSIARALVKSPDIIMADEPTGNLDEENTLRTMSILKAISKSCLVILVTHEKRIARFFADRIIEVSDGRIVRDETNETGDSYERLDDANIYLKEMECETLESGFAQFRIYHGRDAGPVPVRLNLAWKDGKLYIRNEMNCDVLLEGAANGVRMLDEARPELKPEDVENFAYELPRLESDKSARLSRREIWRMAVENIRMMGKKQAFVIVILLVSAVLLSLTMAQISSAVTVDEDAYVGTDSHFLKADFAKVSSVRAADQQWKILEFVWEHLEDSEYGEVFYAPDAGLSLQGQGYTQLRNVLQEVKNYCYADRSLLTEDMMIAGEPGKTRDEVVVDKRVLRTLMKSGGVVSSNYETMEDYLGARFYISSAHHYVTIAGICDSGEPDVYCSQNLMVAIARKSYPIMNEEELAAAYPEVETVTGLADNEILVREGLLKALRVGADEEHTYDVGGIYQLGDDTEHIYTIAGTFPNEVDADYVLNDAGCRNVRDLSIYNEKECYLYAKDAGKAMTELKKLGEDYSFSFELEVTSPYRQELAAYRRAHTMDFGARGLITAVIALICLVLVYFTMKSNAISRSEELTVYRLIGISKQSIRQAYMIEMFLITCYTSLPAVLLTSGVIKLIGSIPSLELHMLVPWWAVLLLLLVIYVIHLAISILPVSGILGKPPAALAVKE